MHSIRITLRDEKMKLHLNERNPNYFVFYCVSFVTDDWLQLSVCHRQILGTIIRVYTIRFRLSPRIPLRDPNRLSATNFHTINICSINRLAKVLFSFHTLPRVSIAKPFFVRNKRSHCVCVCAYIALSPFHPLSFSSHMCMRCTSFSILSDFIL